MSSLVKKLARKIAARKGITRKAHNNPTQNESPDGYEVCHFTKGWRKVSAARAAAATVTAYLKGGA